MGCAGDQIHEPTASPGAGEREVGLAVSRGKLDAKSACGPRAHLAVDHEPTRGLKGYHRRVGARAEVAVDRPGREPLLFQRPLDLAHRRPGHAWLGEPIDDDLGLPISWPASLSEYSISGTRMPLSHRRPVIIDAITPALVA